MKPFVLLLTGMSGSGKTTTARALKRELDRYDCRCQVIDGDESRKLVGNLFGHTREDRLKQTRVNVAIGHYLFQNDISVVYALVCPFEEIRDQFRNASWKNSYVEVFVNAPVEVCQKRDVKGLYQQVKAGTLKNLNGANDTFEAPQKADLVINTDQNDVASDVEQIITLLKERGYLSE